MNSLTVTQKRISTVLKVITIVSAAVGIFLSAYSKHSFMGGTRMFMYFTIQSNIAMAIICAIGLYFMNSDMPVSKAWYVVKFVGTVSITLTGVVFGVLLAPLFTTNPWNPQNTLTHLVVPVVAVLDFFVVAPKARISKKNVGFVIIPPILYAIYAGIGYVRGWEFAAGMNYPYFFLNWGSPAGAFGIIKEAPFMGSAWWILILFIFLILIGNLYLTVADMMYKTCSKRKGN